MQIRVQLAMVLKAIIFQQLIPSVEGYLVPAFEIMFVNNAIRSMIRESKVHQIDSMIYSSSKEGMITMDSYILSLYQKGIISKATAIDYSTNSEQISKNLK
ncbi:MAG: type IV pili twitching motility protein PilT, partial [Clostridiales bacterium]